MGDVAAPSAAGEVDVADQMRESNIAFSKYLQAYTNASVNLLRRWPTFVPDDERYSDTLEAGTAAAMRVFNLPDEGLEAEQANGLHVVGHAKARGSSSSGGAASGGGGGASGKASRPQSTPASDAGNAGASAREEQMREKVERLSAKLRHEVSERSKANDESMRRGQQLQTVQRDNAALQETVRRQAQQLEHSRDAMLRLENQHREFVTQVESADARLVKERKTRHIWQLRAEKYEKKIKPLEAEQAILKDSLSTTVELLEEARRKGSAASSQVTDLSESNKRLANVTSNAVKQNALAREARDNNVLQLELMADRRDELLEQIEQLKTEAKEHEAALEAMERARNEAADLAQEERRLRAIAEEASRKAADATGTAAEERAAVMERASALEVELGTQRQHVSALVTQDAIREAEQKRLFDSVSELLARAQYLGELPPEQLGMSKAEAIQHRDEAMRHLKALREAHALSTYPPQLVLDPSTVATGAAMLNAASHERGTPRGSPRGSPRGGGGGGFGGGGDKPMRATPREEARANMSPRVRAQAAVQGGYSARPNVPPLATAAAQKQQQQQQQQQAVAHVSDGFESWRKTVDHSQVGSEHSPRSLSSSPRGGPTSGRRAKVEDPAREAPPPAKEPAADWEKQKLLSIMTDR